MPSLTLPDKMIWFAHCPKAGGTSIERVLVHRFGDAVGHLHWGWDLWWKAGGWRSANPPNSPQHLVWVDALNQLNRDPDAVFAVVRDPLSRLMSEHRYQRHVRRGTKLGRLLARLPFSTWVRLMMALVNRNPYAFDNHLRRQCEFVPESAKVFRLEEGLPAVGDWLAEVTGVPELTNEFPHELRTKPSSGKLHKEDILAISARYAADYKRFGYTAPDTVGFPPDPIVGLRNVVVGALLPVVEMLERCGKL